MPRGKHHGVELVPSEQGSFHCAQAVLIMAIAALTGRRLTMREAEDLTEYHRSFYTWPYSELLAFARNGVNARVIGPFDVNMMAASPADEIRSVYGDTDEAAAVIDMSRLAETASAAALCLEEPGLSFEIRSASVADVLAGLAQGGLVSVGLDYGVLYSTGRYEGHAVLATGVGAGEIEIYDPGPPGRAAWLVDERVLQAAMDSPRPGLGTVIVLERA